MREMKETEGGKHSTMPDGGNPDAHPANLLLAFSERIAIKRSVLQLVALL